VVDRHFNLDCSQAILTGGSGLKAYRASTLTSNDVSAAQFRKGCATVCKTAFAGVKTGIQKWRRYWAVIDASDTSYAHMRPNSPFNARRRICLPPRSPLRMLQTKIDTVNQGAARMIVAASNTAMPGNFSDESPMQVRSFRSDRTSFKVRGTDQLCQPSLTVEDRQAVLSGFTSWFQGPKRAINL